MASRGCIKFLSEFSERMRVGGSILDFLKVFTKNASFFGQHILIFVVSFRTFRKVEGGGPKKSERNFMHLVACLSTNL